MHILKRREQCYTMSDKNNSNTQTKKRRRSQKGDTPVRINDQLAAATALLHAASQCCQTSAENQQQTLELLLVNMTEKNHKTLLNILTTTLLTIPHELTCELDETTLNILFQTTVSVTTLDAEIEKTTNLNYPGEELAWKIITIESNNHIGLVKNEIKKLIPYLPPTDPGDLLGYGWRGLRAALRQYDPDTGNTLATFACPKINGALRDGIRSEHHLPKRLTTFARKINKTAENLATNLSRTPTYEEIAKELDLAAKEKALLPQLPSPASIDEILEITNGVPVKELSLDETSNPAVLLETLSVNTNLSEGITNLNTEEQLLINSLYEKGTTIRTAARAAGLTVVEAQEAHTQALDKLRQHMLSWA